MIGLFGGTFDPFHNAHRALAKHAVEQLGLEQLIVMPVGRAPHKERRTSFACYRYEMARLGTTGLEHVVVSDDEIRTPGVDYTYHTVKRLKENLGDRLQHLISGSDVLLSIDSWYRPDALLKEVDLAVALRGDADRRMLEGQRQAIEEKYGCRVVFFDMPKMNLSATEIRESLEDKGKSQDTCPLEVESFLTQYRPYDFAFEFESMDDDQWQTLLDIEEWAWDFHPQERRLHAASVAQYAARLAAIYGEDIELAALSGLVHDVAKNLPQEERQHLAEAYFDMYPTEKERLGTCITKELAHGPASAMLVWNESGVRSEKLSEAIALHSSASADMSRFSEILFLADKVAYDRKFDRLDDIRELAESGDMYGAMRLCLIEVLDALGRNNERPCPLTLDASRDYNVI